MKQYTLEELAQKYENNGFTVFVYNEASDRYASGNDDLNKDLLEWQYIKDNIVTNIEEQGNEVVLSYYEEEEEEETEEEEEDDDCDSDGFRGWADYWSWRVGVIR